ncbi:PREDICTED: probable beta-D-xylosidase 6 [Tarenaya hassleriana]|uniref:probable beta-D-xylosidase 6 n=1 Tax=Tarenaya hassleriana TaxID=28532 RepID=UPI00053C8841|nr:PREDICTED: probable beta-D-xylosidase 6 [Tarenaya hassleriana]
MGEFCWIQLRWCVDINCGTYVLRDTHSALEPGNVRGEHVNEALLHLFSVQLRLGLFDGDPRKGQFTKLGSNDICDPVHKKLAPKAAEEGILLLKNEMNLLPFYKNDVSSLGIIGPMENKTENIGQRLYRKVM